jgi:hypothetical protein
MRLFRDHIRLGSLLALIALALNLALSFGHIHAIGGGQRNLLVTAVASSDGGKTGHHDDGLADDRCPICMAASAIGNALAATAPALPHPVAYVAVDRMVEPTLAFVEQPKAAFRSRAPPIS